MTRRQWLWLWLWLLLFFVIFCVWNKLQTLSSDLKTPTQTVTSTASTEVTSPAAVEATQLIKEHKDINLKIIKEDNSVKISGLFSSKEDINRLKSSYQKTFDSVEEDLILIDKDAQNSRIVEVASSMSEDFSKFKSGYLEYVDKTFTIDGIVDDQSVKKSIGDKALMAGNLFVDNKVTMGEAKESTTKPADEDSKNLNDLLKVKNVEFIFAKAKLTKNGEKTVDEVYSVLSKYPNLKIEIGGHTDAIGTRQNNKNLSQNRADTIKNYLVSKGIKSARLNAVGYGESIPLVKNDSSKNRQINRRVEFKIIGE